MAADEATKDSVEITGSNGVLGSILPRVGDDGAGEAAILGTCLCCGTSTASGLRRSSSDIDLL